MRNFKYYFFILFVVGIFFALTFKGILGNPTPDQILKNYSSPGQAFETSQERTRFALTKSIVDHKTFKLDDYASFGLPDLSYKDGHYYSVFPPGVSLILIPAYYLGKYLGAPILPLFVLPMLFAILTSCLIFAISRMLNLSRTASYLAAIIFPLATITWSYSTTLYAHVFSSFCIVAGLYFALRSSRGSGWNHFMVWLLYGLSILIDYPNAILMLPVVIYMIMGSFSRESIQLATRPVKILSVNLSFLLTIIPFLLFVFALGYYNLKTFGHWYDLAHSYRVTEIVKGIADYRFAVKDALDLKFIENGLYTLIFSKGRGIIFFVPILVLSVLGLEGVYKKSAKIANVMVLTILFDLIVYAAFYDPWGGWSYGPRYLIMSMPFLSILVATGYDNYKNKSLYLIVFTLLFFTSFSIALTGALTTNLLPPFPEVGRQVSFISLISSLQDHHSGIIVYNYLQHFISFNLKDYFLAIFGLFSLMFLPIYVHQLGANIVRFFRKIKNPIMIIQRKEV